MIGILLISTRKYKQFVQPLVTQIDANFLPGHEKTIFVFTDEAQEIESTNNVKQITIPPYKFPFATLFRYMIFSQSYDLLHKCSHLFYLDVDMAIVEEVGDEFLTDGLVAVRHPGFYKNDGWGDSNNSVESKSYLPKEKRKHYYCGGVQGGESQGYLVASHIMADFINFDEQKGVRAEWNDETFWNWYLHTMTFEVSITEFSPTYCMVEQPELRKAWGIDDLPVKIIALAKDHKTIRE